MGRVHPNSERKGEIGEEIVGMLLARLGLKLFDKKDRFDKVDFVAYGRLGDHIGLFGFQVKTFACYEPTLQLGAFTGIKIEHYDLYTSLASEYNLPLFLTFVDDALRMVYWAPLERLSEVGEILLPDGRVLQWPDYSKKNYGVHQQVVWPVPAVISLGGSFPLDLPLCDELLALRVPSGEPGRERKARGRAGADAELRTYLAFERWRETPPADAMPDLFGGFPTRVVGFAGKPFRPKTV